MAGYASQDSNYWTQPPMPQQQGQFNFDASGFGQPNQQFEFQSYEQMPGDYSYGQKSFLDPSQSPYSGDLFTQEDYPRGTGGFGDEEDEPPLLEELGIDPDRIVQKTLAVLNPFHRKGQIDDANYLLQDSDLAGPVAFCLVLAAFLLLAGSKAHFGYVYGLAMTSCILMYILLSLMSTSGNITLSSVASVLGYCLLPMVVLAGLGVFTTLRGLMGLVLAFMAVAWASLSASRLFSTMSGEEDQKLLIAYPCVPSDPVQVQQPILVCTAHIHWDPEFCDVKLIQTMMLSNELRSILDQAGQSFRPGHKPDSSNVQLLLCGDFNSLPDSGVIEFLTSGRVAADHRDFKDLAYKSCLQKISVCDKPNEFTHSFKLASAYSEDIMPYTNYTFEFKGIIDYIFYSKQSMVPLGLLGPLSPEWFKEHKVVGCPHPHVPSDHFPLLVELEMTPTVGTSNGLISRR
ncbi:hypothetical protein PUN28_006607 [Cardiocondyla obscurior]|uniref:Endonuclease/exonuclease/phosphatase domain-containing protein n=1 Tax=Cardiocondyla obscurior TaxID=286306 RepID=A0AAW2GE82_9HYME